MFHHRWLSSGLLCSCGLWLCLDVQFVVFVLIVIYIDTCCHGHTEVLVAKYNFCDSVIGVTRHSETMWILQRIPTSLWKCLALFWRKYHICPHLRSIPPCFSIFSHEGCSSNDCVLWNNGKQLLTTHLGLHQMGRHAIRNSSCLWDPGTMGRLPWSFH